MRKVWYEAYTVYSLTLIVGKPWSTHKRGDRLRHYIPHGFDSEDEAQIKADTFNRRSNRIKRGDKLIVESIERPAGWHYEDVLRF